MKIIVSRYKEDIKWTKKFSDVIIYNKGEPLNIDNEIMLENVGREGHTYYQYIYDHYDNLDDYTVFLQGFPFDHSPNIIKNIKKFQDSEYKTISDFLFLSEDVITTCLTEQKNINDVWCLGIFDTFYRIFGKEVSEEDGGNKSVIFATGAQFVVSKQGILSRPKEFYLNIINILKYSSDPIEGHHLERFHKIIFDKYCWYW